jgi:hypothetical protein
MMVAGAYAAVDVKDRCAALGSMHVSSPSLLNVGLMNSCPLEAKSYNYFYNI